MGGGQGHWTLLPPLPLRAPLEGDVAAGRGAWAGSAAPSRPGTAVPARRRTGRRRCPRPSGGRRRRRASGGCGPSCRVLAAGTRASRPRPRWPEAELGRCPAGTLLSAKAGPCLKARGPQASGCAWVLAPSSLPALPRGREPSRAPALSLLLWPVRGLSNPLSSVQADPAVPRSPQTSRGRRPAHPRADPGPSDPGLSGSRGHVLDLCSG